MPNMGRTQETEIMPAKTMRDLLYLWESKGPKTSCGDTLVGVPDVISSQINMFPAQRRQML